MIRILTTEGASAISAFEEGLIPTPEGFTPAELLVGIGREKLRSVYSKNSNFWLKRNIESELLSKTLLLAIFKRGDLHLPAKMLSERTLVIETVFLSNYSELFTCCQQVIACCFNSGASNKLHRSDAKQFDKSAV